MAQERQTPVEEIIVVFKTHFDIGYTDLVEKVVEKYRTGMIDKALAVVEQSQTLPEEQKFVWTLSGWPLKTILADWPGQTEERQSKIRQAFKDGRFVVHALPFTLHSETMDVEDLVRGLRYSSELTDQAGLERARDAKMTDVPSHSWVWPTILKRAGVDFLHLGCNSASSSPEVPLLFFWEGPDGSRLLTMYCASGYGTGIIPPESWNHKTWLALIHTGDNHGPPTPQEVETLFREVKQALPGVKVRIGRLSDFADAIIQEQLVQEQSELPVVRGDMPDTWIHGPMCDPIGEKLVRNVRPQFNTAEILDSTLRLAKQPVSRSLSQFQQELEKAFEQSLLYGEHTWGGSMYWVSSYTPGQINFPYGEGWKEDRKKGRFDKLERSWKDKTDYSRHAFGLGHHLLNDSLQSLWQSAFARYSSISDNAGIPVSGFDKDAFFVIYNPSPWTRTELVEIPQIVKVIDTAGQSRPLELYQWNLENKRGQQVEFIEDGTKILVKAENIPPLGFRCFTWRIAEKDQQTASKTVTPSPVPSLLSFDPKTNQFETPFYSGQIDSKRGTIAKLVDKRTNLVLCATECANEDEQQQLGQVLHEYFDRDQVRRYQDAYVKSNADWAQVELGKPEMPESQYRAVSPEFAQDTVEQNDFQLKIRMTAFSNDSVPYGTTTIFTFYRDVPYIDVETSISAKPADPWPESIWFCFPFAIENPEFRVMRTGSIVDPKRDFVEGSNFDMFWTTGGTAILNEKGQGVAVCPLDHGLISLGEPGNWKYTKKYTPKDARIYVNIFNNQWSTNFRLWNGGNWSSRVRLWGITEYNPETSLVTPSLEARSPLLCVNKKVPFSRYEPDFKSDFKFSDADYLESDSWFFFVPIESNRSEETDSVAGPEPQLQFTKSFAIGEKGLELSRRGIALTSLELSPDEKSVRLRLWEMSGESGPLTITIPKDWQVSQYRQLDLRNHVIGEPVVLDSNPNADMITVELTKFAPLTLELERK